MGGVYRETMLSPRELNIDGLPTQAQTWVNQHITYTHGFGVAMSAVNQVTSDGSPDFLVQDIPPQSVAGLEIEQPRIYYGERGTGYSLVKTKDKEFDYPGPNGDVYDTYKGSGGIPISPLLNRLAFSVKFGTIKFFTTSSIESQSRIIIRNSIQPRISAAAPFLTLDHDPYMVIADGRLWWVQDAYTTTSRYPYSTPQSGVNYLRNSVKIVVDAYNGTMKYYVFDPEDPLLKTYEAAYPSLFTPKDEMPQALLDHLRYPEDLFNVQAEVYSTYHVDNADVLYNKGDQWAIPDNVSLSGPGRMDAYYVIMKLPGAPKEEFLLMLPFVPNGRQNMISWLGARSDLPDYGKSLNYIFSKSYTVFGPSQVEATINQDPDISSQRTLWGQQGSQVIMGNLLVVPIEDSLLYVQPLVPPVDADPAAAAQARDRVLPRAGAGGRPGQRRAGRRHEAHPLGGAARGLRAELPARQRVGRHGGRQRHRRHRRRPAADDHRRDGYAERPGARAHRARQHRVRRRPEGAQGRRLRRVRPPDRRAEADAQRPAAPPAAVDAQALLDGCSRRVQARA